MVRMTTAMLVASAWVFAVAFSMGGCGEASVTFTGTVVEDVVAGHSFDAAANPDGLDPLAGTVATICICRGACTDSCTRSNPSSQVQTDADGYWELSQTFGASTKNHGIEILFEKGGYSDYSYHTVYEESDDPTNGQEFLNVRLSPLAD